MDLLALHRLNVCHLHLTDDQGWRIEIKKYPLLTEIGSMRKSTLIGHESDRPRCYDKTPYGGYYKQDEIKRIVAFAERRHITLVPEIDMLGHMAAAITAYPELGNCKAKTSRAQERMAELGLKSEKELQSWFIRQMNGHIKAAGRRLIGWDEILEGGLADGAAVMNWRGDAGGVEATGQGNDVVMARRQETYYDYYQSEPKEDEPLAIGGLTTLDTVYGYEPIPAAISQDNYHRVLGAQGQLWTEYMKTMDHVEYMPFPRICALSEVLWLEAEHKNYPDLLKRSSQST